MPRHRNASPRSCFRAPREAAVFIGVADVARARIAGAMLATGIRCERQMHAPWTACRPCVQRANRPRGLAIFILELNQAILPGPRARHDRGVSAASIIASADGDLWRFAHG